jgi:beta-glucosidase
MSTTFNDEFLFGAATAAYQIEGAAHEDGKEPSIWDTFCTRPGAIEDGSSGDIACDHYHRLDEDLDLMADLGLQAYRFSISWPRVLHADGSVNKPGMDFYSKLVDGLLARGIEPWVTLYHWDLPQHIEDLGGWPNRDTAERFADYAEKTVSALGDRVANWLTLNEPWCSAFLGYASGTHAPGRVSSAASLAAAHHLNLAHGLGAQAIRAVSSEAKIGIALNVHALFPADDSDKSEQATHALRLIGNEIFLAPLLDGGYPDELIEQTNPVSNWDFLRPGDSEVIHQPLDFLGLNYYSSQFVRWTPTPDSGVTPWICAPHSQFLPVRPPVTEMGWNIDPAAFTHMLEFLANRAPGVPLYVTENGAAFADRVNPDGSVTDTARRDYIEEHLGAVAQAISNGAPVKGYFCWSLMDNFEWALGYTKRFGLIRVDYPTQKRTEKLSACTYRQIIADRHL